MKRRPKMYIGLPKEIKTKENRVALKPSDVETLVSAGHHVLVQRNAGAGAGYSDEEYENKGAELVETPQEVYQSPLIVKVKEPITQEYEMLFKGGIIYAFLHLAANEETKELTNVLLDKHMTAIAYETVKDKRGNLPLLKPMSVIAGQLAIDYGATFLQTFHGGRGLLVGDVEGAEPTHVVVIGGGNVGYSAALKAAGARAKVTLLDINPKKVKQLKRKFSKLNHLYHNIEVLLSDDQVLERSVKDADLLVGAVLVPGGRAPKVITKDMIKEMKDGAVIVDVAIDQGGCTELSEPTSHEYPVYEQYGKLFCNITNMPGAVARTSTQALTKATFPYLLALANNPRKALKNESFREGINIHEGYITCKAVAESLGMEDRYGDLETLLYNYRLI